MGVDAALLDLLVRLLTIGGRRGADYGRRGGGENVEVSERQCRMGV